MQAMNHVVPTVTAENAHIYREEVERVAGFADRIHIDLADGEFAPTKMINPIQAWWPDGLTADIHVMYKNPQEHLETLISLQPNLIIFHAESDCDLFDVLTTVKSVDIKAGLALLPDTQPSDVVELISLADHVLIFGGKLGYHGGEAQLELLNKVEPIKKINPDCEVAWDGGINLDNIQKIASAGINILNVGGFIQKASSPQDAYDILVQKLKQ